MNYILLTLVYILHSIAYINSISSLVVMVLSSIIFVAVFYNMRRHNIDIGACMVALMAASVPISFRNILGGEFSELPITWFYVLGAIYVLLTFIVLREKNKNTSLNYKTIVISITIGFSIIPFLLSANIAYAFKEHMTYLFFLILLLVGSINRNTITPKEYDLIIKFYVFGGLFAALGVIFQYIMFNLFSTSYFRIVFYGQYRKYFSFMFYDMSSATVYMATVAFFLLFSKGKERTLSIIASFLIIIAMATSSARAGLVSLFIALTILALFRRGFTKKIGLLLSLCGFAVISIYILNDVRGLENVASYITYDAGRFNCFINGIKYFLTSPIFGVGYDLGFQMNAAGLVVPHFAFVHLIAQTGVIITFFVAYLIYWVYKESRKKNLYNLKWAILISLIGSCIIPGFFNSRFFTVLALLSILKKNEDIITLKLRGYTNSVVVPRLP